MKNRKKKQVKFMFIVLFSLFIGIYIFISLSNRKYLLGTVGIIIYFIFSIIIFFKYKKNKEKLLQDIFTFFLTFPGYPIIKSLDSFYKTEEYEPYEVNEEKNNNNQHADLESFDMAPFIITIEYGNSNQRKAAVLKLYKSIKNEKVDFFEGIETLRKALDDSHPDVVLYTSDSLTSLESMLIKRINKLKKNQTSPENYINLGKYIYYYCNSGFTEGQQKTSTLQNGKKILSKGLKEYPFNSKLYLWYFRILENLNDKDKLENNLNEVLNKYPVQELVEFAIIYYIKNKNKKKVKETIELFFDKKFKPKKASLQYLLEDSK